MSYRLHTIADELVNHCAGLLFCDRVPLLCCRWRALAEQSDEPEPPPSGSVVGFGRVGAGGLVIAIVESNWKTPDFPNFWLERSLFSIVRFL